MSKALYLNCQKMKIHITKNGQNLGPYNTEEVNKQLRAGIISANDMAWQEGMTDWRPLFTLPGIEPQQFSQAPPTYPPANSPSNLGGEWNVGVMVGACVGTLIIPLIGIIMGIIGLSKHKDKSQGAILLGLGILMMLVYIGLSVE